MFCFFILSYLYFNISMVIKRLNVRGVKVIIKTINEEVALFLWKLLLWRLNYLFLLSLQASPLGSSQSAWVSGFVCACACSCSFPCTSGQVTGLHPPTAGRQSPLASHITTSPEMKAELGP